MCGIHIALAFSKYDISCYDDGPMKMVDGSLESWRGALSTDTIDLNLGLTPVMLMAFESHSSGTYSAYKISVFRNCPSVTRCLFSSCFVRLLFREEKKGRYQICVKSRCTYPLQKVVASNTDRTPSSTLSSKGCRTILTTPTMRKTSRWLSSCWSRCSQRQRKIKARQKVCLSSIFENRRD